jgi:hypothetical protein
MPLISKSIPNLINGVSQQPPEIRLATQAEIQENGLASVANGLEKRPGTTSVKKILATTTGSFHIHSIRRDENESYTVILGGTDGAASDKFIRVFDKDGNEMPVQKNSYASTPVFTTMDNAGLSYFSDVEDFSTDVKATTITDTTFYVSNKRVVTKAATDGETSGQDGGSAISPRGSTNLGSTSYEALVYVKKGGHNSKYVVSIKVGSTYYKVGYQTPATLPVTNQEYIGTDAIADALLNGADNLSGNGWGLFDVSGKDTVIVLTECTLVDTDATITVSSTTGITVGMAVSGTGISEGATVSEVTDSTTLELTSNATVSSSTTTLTFGTAGKDLEKTGFGGRQPTAGKNIDGDTDANFKAGFHPTAGSNMPSGMTCTIHGSVLHFKHTADFSVSTTDSHADTDLFGIKGAIGGGETRSFTNLPGENVPDGFITKIAGDDTRQEDDFYVKFEADDQDKGVWKECPGPESIEHMNYINLPHRLVRLFDDSEITTTNPLGITFVFEAVVKTADDGRTVDSVTNTDFSRIGWNARLAGDDELSPFPSFVGGTLQDIFFHKNRIGFLADENVVMSEAGNYYNFFPTTVITGLDSSPIDVTVSNDKVSLLKHAVPFSESLLFFSELQQFSLNSPGILSPATVSVDVTTQFESDANVKPVSVGRYVFFAFQRGEYSGVREYFVDNSKEVNDAVEITAHVPQYIPGKITRMISSSNESLLVCQSSIEKTNLYIYKYYWQAQDKIQSSWSVWKFGAGNEVINCQFIGSTLQILIKRNDGIYLENINLSTDTAIALTEDKTSVLLDRRVKLEYDASFTLSATNLPYYATRASLPLVYVTDQARKIAEADVNAYLRVAQNTSGVPSIVFVGIPFTFKYEFTQFLYKVNDIASRNAKLQLRNINVLYSDTGFFKIKVDVAPYTIKVPDPDNVGSTKDITPRTAYEKTFSGFITNSSQINEYKLLSGSFRSSILSSPQNCKVLITNDEYLPCSFQSAEWEGFLHTRSERI